MYIPGRGEKTLGRPDVWVSRCSKVIDERRPPANSGITSQTRVVKANWPSSIARNTMTLVIALVVEKMLNTASFAIGRFATGSAQPIASSRPSIPPRVTLMTAP